MRRRAAPEVLHAALATDAAALLRLADNTTARALQPCDALVAVNPQRDQAPRGPVFGDWPALHCLLTAA